MVDNMSGTLRRRVVSLFLREGITISGEALDAILKKDDPIDFAASLLDRLKALKYKPIILRPEEIHQLTPPIMTPQEKTENERPRQKGVPSTRGDFVEGPLPLRKGKYTIKRRGYTVRLEIKKPRRRRSSSK